MTERSGPLEGKAAWVGLIPPPEWRSKVALQSASGAVDDVSVLVKHFDQSWTDEGEDLLHMREVKPGRWAEDVPGSCWLDAQSTCGQRRIVARGSGCYANRVIVVSDTNSAAAFIQKMLPHLRASVPLTAYQYRDIGRAALSLMTQVAPQTLTAPSLALARLPIRGDNPRTLRYAGSVRGEQLQTDVEISILADSEGPPVVGVRSKPLPEPPFWDVVGEAVVSSIGEDRLVRIRLLLQVSGHTDRAALWQQYEVSEPGKFAHALATEVAHLSRAASALGHTGGLFGVNSSE